MRDGRPNRSFVGRATLTSCSCEPTTRRIENLRSNDVAWKLRAARRAVARQLYQSTGRPIDAHDVLGPALAGFSPTPEFAEIAEAKALFEALALL
jgi:hypothetical protein